MESFPFLFSISLSSSVSGSTSGTSSLVLCLKLARRISSIDSAIRALVSGSEVEGLVIDESVWSESEAAAGSMLTISCLLNPLFKLAILINSFGVVNGWPDVDGTAILDLMLKAGTLNDPGGIADVEGSMINVSFLSEYQPRPVAS